MHTHKTQQSAVFQVHCQGVPKILSLRYNTVEGGCNFRLEIRSILEESDEFLVQKLAVWRT